MTDLRIAVLTLTRDRLDFTKYCFQTLRDNAGCWYDHFVYDNGSTDGTLDWLINQDDLIVFSSDENIGLCRGLNKLLDDADVDDYDVIVRFDNDCEVLTPDTLRICAEIAADYGAIVAPTVHGLQNPPHTFSPVGAGEHVIDQTQILGGIFMAIPAYLFTDHGYRYDESHHLHTGDEAIVPWWRAQGGIAGYVRDLHVNHYMTTDGQLGALPDYFARKDREWATA